MTDSRYLFAAVLVLLGALTSWLGAQQASAQRQPGTQAAMERPMPAEPEKGQLGSVTARADSAYIAILEKTNQQLSLWWNPYGVLISALGTLFAVFAIAAAVVLFRQGKDYRDLLDRQVAGYQKILDAFIADKNEQLAALQQDIGARLSHAEEQFAKATGEQKEHWKTAIENLKLIAETVKPHRAPTRLTFADRIEEGLSPFRLGTEDRDVLREIGYLTPELANRLLLDATTCAKCGGRLVSTLLTGPRCVDCGGTKPRSATVTPEERTPE